MTTLNSSDLLLLCYEPCATVPRKGTYERNYRQVPSPPCFFILLDYFLFIFHILFSVFCSLVWAHVHPWWLGHLSCGPS